jgi:DNA-binding NarL/FixJ family response regulator
MRILIVDDDNNKLGQIHQFLAEILQGAQFVEARSYQGGLREVVRNTPDMMVLDMSMPTFDPAGGNSRWRPFAGRDVLREMQRHKIHIPVVIVTQFENFGDGTSEKTLQELAAELARDFPLQYVGTVYYHAAQSQWKVELERHVRQRLAGGERE